MTGRAPDDPLEPTPHPEDAEATPAGSGPGTTPPLTRNEIFSWLSGPRAAAEQAGVDLGYRGERLGCPERGSGSVASFGRRLVALVLDWGASLLVAYGLGRGRLEYGSDPYSLLTLAVFATEVFVLTSFGGASFGQRLRGLHVRRVDGRPLGPVGALVRTALLCLVVPALIWDRDGRGLHDKAVGSVVVER